MGDLSLCLGQSRIQPLSLLGHQPKSLIDSLNCSGIRPVFVTRVTRATTLGPASENSLQLIASKQIQYFVSLVLESIKISWELIVKNERFTIHFVDEQYVFLFNRL